MKMLHQPIGWCHVHPAPRIPSLKEEFPPVLHFLAGFCTENNRISQVRCQKNSRPVFNQGIRFTNKGLGFPTHCPSWPTIVPADGHDNWLKILFRRVNRRITCPARSLHLYLTGKVVLDNLEAGGTDEKNK